MQTLTFLFTDIEGSMAMLLRLGDAYAQVLADHHQLVRAALAAYGGKEIDTQGDAFFAVLSSPSGCVAGQSTSAGIRFVPMASRRDSPRPHGNPLR